VDIGKMKDPQARLDHMSKVLNLSDDQKAKIKPILDNEAQQMQSLKSDTSTAKQDRHAKAMEVHKSTMDQIRPILNADQQAKLDQQMQKMKEHRAKRGGQKQGASATPQS
jgi:periplasmic protein CpxP/Spy